MATSAYRQLLRAARLAFDGDTATLTAARNRIRDGFREKSGLTATDPSIPPAIQHAQEVAAFLRSNLVQAKKQENGNYKLRIHEETERGDNDTVKIGDGKTIKIDGKTCADR